MVSHNLAGVIAQRIYFAAYPQKIGGSGSTFFMMLSLSASLLMPQIKALRLQLRLEFLATDRVRANSGRPHN